MHHGYSLAWIASDINVPVRTIQRWMYKGLFEGVAWHRGPGRGHPGYSPEFLQRARAIEAVRQCWPRGPMENWRDRILHPEDDDE